MTFAPLSPPLPTSSSLRIATVALVLGIVAVVLAVITVVFGVFLPLLTQSVRGSVDVVLAIVEGVDFLTAAVGLVAAILGSLSLIRVPRLPRGGFAIGAGGGLFLTITVSQLTNTVLAVAGR